MEFRLTSEGIFLITSIDPESPNFTMQRINVGDEIVEVVGARKRLKFPF